MSDKHLAYSTVFVVREFETHEAIIRKGVLRRSDPVWAGCPSQVIRKTQFLRGQKYPI